MLVTPVGTVHAAEVPKIAAVALGFDTKYFKITIPEPPDPPAVVPGAGKLVKKVPPPPLPVFETPLFPEATTIAVP
jgi:hypothetical protein